MDFFEGFSWAVPLAFKDALSNCRFEEGDILYDSQKAYEGNWEEGKKHFKYMLQISSPARSVGGSQNFGYNWESEVQFDFYSTEDEKQRIKSTQGRLYWMLWKGQVGAWEVSPPIPRLVNDIPDESVSLESFKGYSLKPPFFVLPMDNASELLRKKKHDIFLATKSHLDEEPFAVSLKEIGVKNWKDYLPTIELVVFQTSNQSGENLHDQIKSVVYKPSKTAKRSQFRIKAHGWFFGKDSDERTSLFG